MHYGQMRQYDIANGTGIRSTVFVTGCSRHCVNCFNPEYQDPAAGQEWTEKETKQLLEWLQAPTNSGLTLLGGEPMENTQDLTTLVKIVKEGRGWGLGCTASWRMPRKKPWQMFVTYSWTGLLSMPSKIRDYIFAAHPISGSLTCRKPEHPARSRFFGRMDGKF